MVFLTLPEEAVNALQAWLKARNVVIASGRRVRLVTHLDVSKGDVETVIGLVTEFFSLR
jgi:threonine aldolase